MFPTQWRRCRSLGAEVKPLNLLFNHSWPVLQFYMTFRSCPLNYLGLVDQRGMGAEHRVALLGFRPECAISLPVACAESLGHLGAVCLAVPVIRMLPTGGTPQTFIFLILVVCYRWEVAAQRRLLVTLGDASWPWTPVCRENGAAVELSYILSGRYH